MPVCKKQFFGGEEMYIFFPGNRPRTPFKRSAVYVLTDEVNDSTVGELLEEKGLARLALDGDFLVGIPVPPAGGWKAADPELFPIFRNGINKPEDGPDSVTKIGFPTVESMLSTWHPMLDVQYVIGIGDGADYALRLGCEKPEWLAGIWSVGGKLTEGYTPIAPMPVWLTGADKKTVEAFKAANETDTEEGTISFCGRNPSQRVITEELPVCEASFRRVWTELFRKVRRVNTRVHGDITDRMGDPRKLFACFIEDERLDGTPHTWFAHTPSHAKPGERFPLVFFYHGGSDNPSEAAEMARLHELGEKERFMTVYVWGTNRCSWNCNLEPEMDDDLTFCAELIRYMTRNYPVDEQRVYVSGFSNGAAMAQCVGLCYPELVAGVFHIDSNWPGIYGGCCELDWHDVKPFALAMKKKETFDYRMPCWYTYGSRERSYPVWKGCTQQHQYDFWKLYNGISIRPTPAEGEEPLCEAGVPGDVDEKLTPSVMYPDHWYEIHRFTDEKGRNLYNYVIMHDKGHDIAQKDAELGWNYVKQFRRLPDGSLGKTE